MQVRDREPQVEMDAKVTRREVNGLQPKSVRHCAPDMQQTLPNGPCRCDDRRRNGNLNPQSTWERHARDAAWQGNNDNNSC